MESGIKYGMYLDYRINLEMELDRSESCVGDPKLAMQCLKISLKTEIFPGSKQIVVYITFGHLLVLSLVPVHLLHQTNYGSVCQRLAAKQNKNLLKY